MCAERAVKESQAVTIVLGGQLSAKASVGSDGFGAMRLRLGGLSCFWL